MVSNITKILKENEFDFCRSWHTGVLNTDNNFLTMYNKEFYDDYFINRTIINKNLHFNPDNKEEIEKAMHPLIELSKEKKITINLHIGPNQPSLEEYLILKNFIKIDEVIGLHYPKYPELCISDSQDRASKQSDQLMQILVVDNFESLKKWIRVYCLSFNIHKDKEKLIYRILREKFNIFKFVLAEKNGIGENNKQNVGCSILFYHNDCIALYCLGTLKEYRNKNIATNVINYSIGYGREKGCQIFGLQTLKSDNLLSFYQKKGFAACYSNKVYRFFDS